MASDPAGKIVTFYSYKGGTGRSMSLANVACLLANQQEKVKGKGVLMIDWDLEAPGLHRFFRNMIQPATSQAGKVEQTIDKSPGLIDLFLTINKDIQSRKRKPDEEFAYSVMDKIDLDQYILSTAIPSLHILKAGCFDGEYPARVNTFDWEQIYNAMPGLFRAFADALAQHYAYVLIDSRTGITDTSGICTMLMPEKLVVVFTPNRQSLPGCLDLVRRATNYRKQSDDLRSLTVYPLVCRVVATETALVQQWRFGDHEADIEGYQPQFEKLFQEVYDVPKCDLTEYFDEVQIQQISDYAFGEQIAVLVERGGDRLSLTRSFETFTERLLRLNGPWQDLEKSHKNNLPVWVTSFIGRKREISEIKQLMNKTRLLTLTGSGGIGKTRLALQLAAGLLDKYSDGVWLVELSMLSNPSLVPQVVASVFGLHEQAGMPTLPMLIDYLKQKDLLMILDGCEHLLPSCAELVDAILRTCPMLKILATSRQALHVGGEAIYLVPSLAIPDFDELSSLSKYDSVQLFIERAKAIRPEFSLNEQSSRAITQICLRLDGVPLALELAAARTRVLSVEQINARLNDRFHLLTGGSRSVLPRQSTLRATIDWSYDLLSKREKELLHRISVFAGGFTLEAAEAVCLDESIESWEILDLLSSLVDKSLLLYEDGRYWMLETIRQYGWERLQASGHSEEFHNKHLDFFLRLSEQAKQEWVRSEQADWFKRLEIEHANLRTALAWSLSIGNATAGLRMAAALCNFWEGRGYLSEGRDHLNAILSLERAQEPTQERAEALNAAGSLASSQGDYVTARTYFEESLTISRQLNNKLAIGAVLGNLGNVAFFTGDYKAAQMFIEESLVILQELDDNRGIASTLNNLGNLSLRQANYDEASKLYKESLHLFEQAGDKTMVATVLSNQGMVASLMGQYKLAQSLLEQSLATFHNIGSRRDVMIASMNLGDISFQAGNYAIAQTYFEESLQMAQEVGDKLRIGELLIRLGDVKGLAEEYNSAQNLLSEGLRILSDVGDRRGMAIGLEKVGYLAIAQRKYRRAIKLIGAADVIRSAIGAPRHPDEHERYDINMAIARKKISAQLLTVMQEGMKMSIEQAVLYALEEDENERQPAE